jgi:hypothetical protein
MERHPEANEMKKMSAIRNKNTVIKMRRKTESNSGTEGRAEQRQTS